MITPFTKRVVRISLQSAFTLAHTLRLARIDHRVVTLCYHSVRANNLYPFSTLTSIFEAHLAWLAEHCNVVDFSQVQRVQPASRPTVAITFDDGYMDNVSDALPLLQKYKLPATFFITTGFLTRDALALGRISKSYKVTPDQLGALDFAGLKDLYSGGMSIGGHGHTHRRMKTLPEAELREELYKSKSILEEHLGQEITSMAYPYGLPGFAFDMLTCKIVQEVGYTLVGAVHYRSVRPTDSPYQIPRFVITNETVGELKGIVLGALDLMGWYQDIRYR